MARLLIADDDELYRGLLERALTDAGHEIQAFDSGEAALDSFQQLAPHLVITDVFMPGMDGLSFIFHLRQLDPELPILAISGGTDAFSPRTGLKPAQSVGANRVLTKPVRLKDLRAAVAELLEARTGTPTPA